MINKDIIKIIRENYHARDHNNDYKKDNLGFGLIHYSLIRNIRPKNVLVLGSQRGFVPSICALACKDEDKGEVDFVDAGYNLNDEKSWGGIGLWREATDEYWDPIQVRGFIKLHNMTIEDFIQFGHIKKYEYIYIDGDHSYEGIAKDTTLLWPYLKKGGYMLFHDVCVDKETQWGKCEVKRYWEVKIKKQFRDKRINEFLTLPFEAGLGIVRKT